MGKTGTIEPLFGRNLEMGYFGIAYPEAYES
jgi:hypothetical protein